MTFVFDLQLFFDGASSAASQTQAASQQAVTNALNILAQQKQQAISGLQGYMQQNPMPFSNAQVGMPNYAGASSFGGGSAGGMGGLQGYSAGAGVPASNMPQTTTPLGAAVQQPTRVPVSPVTRPPGGGNNFQVQQLVNSALGGGAGPARSTGRML